MHQTDSPLFDTEGFGAVISRVRVFPTHVMFQQHSGRDIYVPVEIIASVEERELKNEFVILLTTTRRRIICTVRPEGSALPPKRATALCEAIRSTRPTTRTLL